MTKAEIAAPPVSPPAARGRVIALGAAFVTVAAVATALFFPWFVDREVGGPTLRRYMPLTDGGARLSVGLDADGRPGSWSSANDIVIPPALSLAAELRPAHGDALREFLRREGEGPLEHDVAQRRLAAEAQLYQTRTRRRSADGAIRDTVTISVRNGGGDYLIGSYAANGAEESVFEPPLPAFDARARLGFEWRGEGVRRFGESSVAYLYEAGVTALEPWNFGSATIPDCLKIRSVLTFTQDEKVLLRSTADTWYAPGVGVVEWHEFDDAGKTTERHVTVAATGMTPHHFADLTAPHASPPSPTTKAEELRSASPRQEERPWRLRRFATLHAGLGSSAGSVTPAWVPGTPPLIIASAQGGELTALTCDSDTGDVSWRFRPEGQIFGAPTYDSRSNRLYFGTTNKKLYALDAQGFFAWSFTVGDNVATRPVVAEGNVVFGSEDRHIYAVDAAQGTEKWRHRTGGAVASSPVAYEDIVVFGSHDGTVYAIDVDDGAVRWTYDAGDAIFGPLEALGDRIYAATADGELMELRAADGRATWRIPVGRDAGARFAVTDRAVFVIFGNRLSAYDRSSGIQLWRLENEEFLSPPAGENNSVVVASGSDMMVRRIDLDGRVVETWRADETADDSSSAAFVRGPSLAGDAYWLLDSAATLYRLGPSLGGATPLKPLWSKRFWQQPFLRSYFNLTPVPHRDRLIVVDDARNVYRMHPLDGTAERIGRIGGDRGRLVVEPVAADDALLASVDNSLVAMSLIDGKTLWTREGSGAPLHPPVVHGRDVFWITLDSQSSDAPTATLHRLDLHDGSLRQKHPLTGFAFCGGGVATDDKFFVSTPPSAYDFDGKQIWISELKERAFGGPALDAQRGRLYVALLDEATEQGFVAALRTDDGTQVWKAELKSSTPHPFERPWCSGDLIIVPLLDGEIAALSAVDGRELWRHKPVHVRRGAITVDDGRVWFFQQNSEVVALDAATGRPVARFNPEVDLNSIAHFAPRPALVGGRLIAPLASTLQAFEVPADEGRP